MIRYRALMMVGALALSSVAPARRAEAAPTPTLNLRPMLPVDLGLLQNVGNPQMSPDGRWLLFEQTETDYQSNSTTRKIRMVIVADGWIRSIVKGTSPCWSPDSRFIAYRAAKAAKGENHASSGDEIWVFDLADRSKRMLTRVHHSNHFLGHRARKNFAFSPDGKHLAFVGADPAPPANKDDEPVLVFDRLLFKSRTSFSDGRRSHIWIVPTTGGEPRCLTPGTFDEHSLTWSPDGNRIAFVSNRTKDPDNNHQNDLWIVDVKSSAVVRLTDSVGTEVQPAWSLDGKTIAYLATVRPINTKDSSPENRQLFVISAQGGSPRNLTKSLDRRIRSFEWHPDSHSLFFTFDTEGMTPLYTVSLESADITPVIEDEFRLNGFSISRDGGHLAYTKTSVTKPTELWLDRTDGSKPIQVTDQNHSFRLQIQAATAETFWFKSFDAREVGSKRLRHPRSVLKATSPPQVQGWLMPPVDRKPGKKYPLILWVHGGPHGMYGYSFSSRFQLLAARGYGVVYINPRGSTGYGQAFADGCVMNWGGGDYKDLMAGVDHVLSNNDWIDAERLGVVGGSYGGFMTNWIVTQTDRFKAAVSVASVSNLISFYGTSLYTLLIEVEFNGKPWDNYPTLWQWSPLAHIKNVKTPTLLLHGADDHDVPIGQAEEMYVALKKLSVPTLLVRYPNEGHGFRRPKHVVDYLERTMGWFDWYLKPR